MQDILRNTSTQVQTPPDIVLRPSPGQKQARLPRSVLLALVSAGAVLLFWQLIVSAEIYPAFVLPAPAAVAERLFDITFGDSRIRLGTHLLVTLQEITLGLSLGVLLGFTLGYLIARNRLLEGLLSPLIVALQATPVVAYAPMLVILFGTGLESKVFTAVLIVFFPMLMNTIVGVRSTPRNLYELMRSLRATRWQMFRKLELPAALPVLFGGLKMSVTLSVIGAVVGEFVGASAGLGALVMTGRNTYDAPLVIAAVLTLTVLALSLYGLVAALERRALAWQQRTAR